MLFIFVRACVCALTKRIQKKNIDGSVEIKTFKSLTQTHTNTYSSKKERTRSPYMFVVSFRTCFFLVRLQTQREFLIIKLFIFIKKREHHIASHSANGCRSLEHDCIKRIYI
jgi:hypothetical protein